MRFGHLIPFGRKQTDFPFYRHPFDTLLRDLKELPARFSHDIGRLEGKEFAVDVIDRDKEILIRAEVPGISLSDLAIDVDQNILTIRGERKVEKKKEEENYYLLECQCGAFSRSLQLPFVVEKNQEIEAELKNGILTVSIPKPEAVQREMRKITIKAV